MTRLLQLVGGLLFVLCLGLCNPWQTASATTCSSPTWRAQHPELCTPMTSTSVPVGSSSSVAPTSTPTSTSSIPPKTTSAPSSTTSQPSSSSTTNPCHTKNPDDCKVVVPYCPPSQPSPGCR